jgi:hypothetical protein
MSSKVKQEDALTQSLRNAIRVARVSGQFMASDLVFNKPVDEPGVESLSVEQTS